MHALFSVTQPCSTDRLIRNTQYVMYSINHFIQQCAVYYEIECLKYIYIANNYCCIKIIHLKVQKHVLDYLSITKFKTKSAVKKLIKILESVKQSVETCTVYYPNDKFELSVFQHTNPHPPSWPRQCYVTTRFVGWLTRLIWKSKF